MGLVRKGVGETPGLTHAGWASVSRVYGPAIARDEGAWFAVRAAWSAGFRGWRRPGGPGPAVSRAASGRVTRSRGAVGAHRVGVSGSPLLKRVGERRTGRALSGSRAQGSRYAGPSAGGRGPGSGSAI